MENNLQAFEEFLTRMYQTIPFPMDVKEFYRSFEDGQPPKITATHPVYRRNAASVISWNDIVLVQLAPSRKYFKLKFPDRVPAPIGRMPYNPLHCLVVSHEHAKYGELLQWHEAMYKLDEQLGRLTEAVDTAISYKDCIYAWTEILPILQLKGKRVTKRHQKLLDTAVPPALRNEVNDMVARALLLPAPVLPAAFIALV